MGPGNDILAEFMEALLKDRSKEYKQKVLGSFEEEIDYKQNLLNTVNEEVTRIKEENEPIKSRFEILDL